MHEAPEVVVTLLERAGVSGPMRVDGRVVLDAESPIVWFTFPGAWHDIGRFHDGAGRFTGYYANVLTPVRFEDGRSWSTTDLYLDVWRGADGSVRLLDEDELDEALTAGDLDPVLGDRARAEAARLVAAATAGDWPPRVTREWTLERCRRTLGRGAKPGDGPRC